MSEERVLAMIQETIDGLYKSALIPAAVKVNVDTVLLGTGSPLDSLAFVTFIADLEDRLTRESGREVSLVLSELHDFNTDVLYLSAGVVARYVANLTSGN